MESTHIVFLAETKETANLRRTLGTETFRVHRIRQARNILLALLDNGKCQYRQIHAHNAASHALPFPFTCPAGTVAAVAVAEQQADTRRVHYTLLHWEPLLVIPSGYAEDVSFELVADAVSRHLLTHAAVHEDTQLAVIVDFDQLLRPIGRVGDVELHLDNRRSR